MSAQLPKPLRLEVRLRNNRLIRAREAAGYATQTDAAKALGIVPNTLCNLENLKLSPWNRARGDWTKTATRIALLYKVPCEELWPDVVRRVERTEATIELDEPEVSALAAHDVADLDAEVDRRRLQDAVTDALAELPAQMREVVRAHAIEGETFDAIGERQGLSRERIRQIELQAFAAVRRKIERLTREDPAPVVVPWEGDAQGRRVLGVVDGQACCVVCGQGTTRLDRAGWPRHVECEGRML